MMSYAKVYESGDGWYNITYNFTTKSVLEMIKTQSDIDERISKNNGIHFCTHIKWKALTPGGKIVIRYYQNKVYNS